MVFVWVPQGCYKMGDTFGGQASLLGTAVLAALVYLVAITLSSRAVTTLLAAVRDVLEQALAEGGTSFDAQYVNVNGASGYFSHSLNAYGQHGKPCPRCSLPASSCSPPWQLHWH